MPRTDVPRLATHTAVTSFQIAMVVASTIGGCEHDLSVVLLAVFAILLSAQLTPR